MQDLREAFWADYYTEGFEFVLDKYSGEIKERDNIVESAKYIVITPDGAGSKGDEAIIRGFLNIISGENVLFVNPNERAPWADVLLDRALDFREYCIDLPSLEKCINKKAILLVLGTDLLDGTCTLPDSLYRFKAMEKMADLGGSVFAFCSFRSNVSQEIISQIRKLGDRVNYFLRDYISVKNFEKQTGLKGNFFPDFAFYCEKTETSRVSETKNRINEEKLKGKTIVGLNFSEQSFSSFYEIHDIENRLKYVRTAIDAVKRNTVTPFFLLISHDSRKWDNHLSDVDYQKIAYSYLSKMGEADDALLLDPDITHTELLPILHDVDVVISGRMHLAVAAFRSGVLPIIFTGAGTNGLYNMLDKVSGMFLERINCTNFVATNSAELIAAVRIVLTESNIILQKLEEYNNKNTLEELKHKEKLQQILNIQPQNSNYNIEPCFSDAFVIAKNRIEQLKTKLIEFSSNEQQVHINLKQEILNRDGHIELLLESERRLQETERVLNIQIKQKNRELKVLAQEKDRELELLTQEEKIILREKEKEIRELKQTLVNKEGHIKLLLESDRELERIKSSRSWRYMSCFWKLRDKIVPFGSKRRLLIKMAIKFAKHPVCFFKKLTPKRVGKFFRTLRKEGAMIASRRLDDCLTGSEIQHATLEVNKIEPSVLNTLADYEPITFKQVVSPSVSIIIPVYNQFDYTYNCLKSVLQNSGNISYEVIIADDCSTDLTVEIENIVHNINIITNRSNLRFLNNCNNASRFAKGDYILFLNNDTQVQENWLAPLVELIKQNENIGMVGSKLVYPDGRLQEAGGIIWKDGSAWNFGNHCDPNEPEFNYVKEADYISGASIMIRSTLWKEIGGFDELYAPAYCEDSDLAFEVRKRGYKVIYQPKSVVVHFEGVSNGIDLSCGQKHCQLINQKKFYNKWRSELVTNHFDCEKNIFQARDHSKNKKTILVIDHYVPQYDKDAGSRTVYQYLKLFADIGYNVKFIGDNFCCHEPYTTTLQQMGIEVLYGSNYEKHWKDWVEENGESINYAFLNRPHISEKYIDFIRKHTAAKIIYYGHDLHFLREMREYELTGNMDVYKSSVQWRKKEFNLMRKADCVYYPSCVEEQKIRELDPTINVKVIPAYIFDTINRTDYQFDSRKDIMFIGGFGHKPNIDAVKWLAQEIMPQLSLFNYEIRVHVLGSNPPDEIMALGNERIIIHGFVTDEQLKHYYRSCRLSIVPLRYGAGIKGKVIESMQFGLPVITTTIGAEGIDNNTGFLCIEDDAVEMAKKIAELYSNDKMLQKMSSLSYDYVEKKFTTENAIKVIRSDFGMV